MPLQLHLSGLDLTLIAGPVLDVARPAAVTRRVLGITCSSSHLKEALRLAFCQGLCELSAGSELLVGSLQPFRQLPGLVYLVAFCDYNPHDCGASVTRPLAGNMGGHA